MTEQTGNSKPNEAEGLAFPLSGNEKLIESVRDWPTITRMSHSTQLEKLVELRDALEAAGKAHTPTDDEPEALRIAELDARQAAYRKEREDWFVDHEAEPEIATNAFFRGWDAAVGGGFRRSEVVPEPSTECPQPCVHLSQHDAREGRTCAEHPCTCSEPQGEPSDAQITAEALRKWPHDPNDVNVSSARAARRLSFLQGALWMRAALRAGGVR